MRLWAVAAAWTLGACAASWSSTAQLYRDAGRHELAALYYAQAYQRALDDPEARAQLEQSVDLALRSLGSDYDAALRGDPLRALGIAVRQEEVSTFASALGLQNHAGGAAARVREVSSAAARDALRAVDEAEASGAGAGVMLETLRRALALSPNDAELSRRYAALKSRNERRVGVRVRCSGAGDDVCRTLATRVLSAVTLVRRELFVAVPAGAPEGEPDDGRDAELVVELRLDRREAPFSRTSDGQSVGAVPELDRFQEPVLDKKGKPVLAPVRARWEVYAATHRVALSGTISLLDLRRGGAPLFRTTVNESLESSASYYTWTGDHRALEPEITAHGTDQTPPTSAADLARQAVERAAVTATPGIVDAVENPRGGTT